MNGKPRRYNLLEWFVILAMMVILAVSSANVVGRYFFRAPLFWSDELSTILFVWVTFLGGAVAVATNAHMSVDFFFNKMPIAWKKAVQSISGVMVIATLLYLTVEGAKVTILFTDQASPSLPISRAWAFIPIPIGCGVMAFYLVLNIMRNLRKQDTERG